MNLRVDPPVFLKPHLKLFFLCLSFLQILFFSTLSLAASPGGSGLYVPGEILVQLRADFRPEDKDRVSKTLGKAHDFHFRNDLLRIEIAGGLSVEDALSQIKRDPAVFNAQPNYRYHLFETCTVPTSSSDAYYTSGDVPAAPCGGLTGNGNVNWPYLLINAPAAWALAASSLSCPPASPVTVAVLDTGVASNYLQTNHPDLPSSLFIPGYNSSDDWGGDTTDTIDNHGHGTYVTGILAAQWNNAGSTNACSTGTVPSGAFNGGAVGVAGYPGMVKIMPVKVSDSTGASTSGTILEGIYYAALNGAQVMNLSVGTETEDLLMGQAVTFALDKGCMVVAAVGNSGNGVPLAYPAAFPGVVAVGAVTPSDVIASYSQTGTGMGIVAPGGAALATAGIFDTADNFFGCMLNCPLVTADTDFQIDPCDNNYGVAAGTSASSPMVAGAAAFLLSLNPSLSVVQVAQILESTAFQIIGAQGTYNTTSGWGRLDLNAAAESALAMGVQPASTPTPTPLPATPTPIPGACGGTIPGASWTLNAIYDFQSVDGAVFDPGSGNGPGPFLLGGPGPTNPALIYYWQAGTWNAFGSTQAPLLNRTRFNVEAFNGYLWVLGGLMNGATYQNDTWYSFDGLHYLLGTANAGFAARSDFSSAVFQNALWVLGGQTSTGLTNNAWSSPNGLTWTGAATPPFSPREGQAAVTFNGRLWVIGGQTSAGVTNDIWSTGDGINWSQSVPSGPVFSSRAYHLAVACGNAIWVMGGTTASGPITDLWVSQDGTHWTQTLTQAPFGPVARYSQVNLAFQDQVWSMGPSNAYTSNCCMLPTFTSTPSYTPTASPTFSPTPTPSPTGTPTRTTTQTPTATSTVTFTSTSTTTPTSTGTPSGSSTFTLTPTATVPSCFSPALYPNPAPGSSFTLNLNLCVPTNVRVQLFTTAFRKVLDKNLGLIPIGVDQVMKLQDNGGIPLANGLYYVVVRTSPIPGSGQPAQQWIGKLLIIR